MPRQTRRAPSRRPFELALLGNALVRLTRALDAVLQLVALGGEHPDHLVGAVAVAAPEQACDDVDVVADAELVSQGSLRITQNRVRAAATAVGSPSSWEPCLYNSTENPFVAAPPKFI